MTFYFAEKVESLDVIFLLKNDKMFVVLIIIQ